MSPISRRAHSSWVDNACLWWERSDGCCGKPARREGEMGQNQEKERQDDEFELANDGSLAGGGALAGAPGR